MLFYYYFILLQVFLENAPRDISFIKDVHKVVPCVIYWTQRNTHKTKLLK